VQWGTTGSATNPYYARSWETQVVKARTSVVQHPLSAATVLTSVENQLILNITVNVLVSQQQLHEGKPFPWVWAAFTRVKPPVEKTSSSSAVVLHLGKTRGKYALVSEYLAIRKPVKTKYVNCKEISAVKKGNQLTSVAMIHSSFSSDMT
jgi:hypothetical protein